MPFFRPMLRRMLGLTPTEATPAQQDPPNQQADAAAVNRLVSTAPAQSDELPIEVTPWAVRRLRAIFEKLNHSPNQQAVQDAQAARLCFTRFWLSAPVDHLEPLYRGPIGEAYRLMLAGVLPALPLSAEDERWKKALSHRLLKGFGSHETTNLLLAVMPFYDLNTMKVADPLRQIPEWLLMDYAERCDPDLRERLAHRRPVSQALPALLGPAGQGGNGTQSMPVSLPVLWERRGEQALREIQDSEFLGRMSGLINLYAIDPNDSELKAELSTLRRKVAQIWLDVDTDQLQSLYRTPFGQLTQNLIGSGFCRESLGEQESLARRQLGQIVAEMRHPRSLNALMAALLYYPPGKVNVHSGENLLPSWLLQELSSLRNRALVS
jgi:hypothetical protein